MGIFLIWILKLLQGYLHNDKQITVIAGAAFCTTKYGTISSESGTEQLEWDEIALYPVDLFFATPGPIFQFDDTRASDDLLEIGQYARFILR